jgi:flagellar basal body-associated protein FliL
MINKSLCSLAICGLLLACGKPNSGKEGISTTETAATTQTNTSDTATTKTTSAFLPELLLSDRQTKGLTVEIPQVRTLLTKSPDNFVRLTIVVECANEASRNEAKVNLAKLSGAVSESLSSKTAAFVESMDGKLKLKEEIIWRMQRMMQIKGIKQVYFQEFSIEKP